MGLFYRGVRVYHRLSHVPSGGAVFCIDNGASRSFARFDNLESFETWYTGLAPDDRTVNEVIRSDMRKLVLDIDDPGSDSLRCWYDFEMHVSSRIHDVFFALDIGTPDIVFYSMCSNHRLSYHVVVSNCMFSAQTCAGLCMIISSNQAWECCVDVGVYKRLQFIRVEMSTKFGERRWKERITRPGPLRQGIISDPDGAPVSDLVVTVPYTAKDLLPIGGVGNITTSCGTISCSTAGLPLLIKGQFRIGKYNGMGIVPLYRTAPGFCIQCNRRHDRENAFVKASLAGPVFVCWRYYYSCK
jgi:hypothetical protein